jgi:hypothetical protein
LAFWSLVMVVKILFDTYVLWPSVAGVTIDSICHTPPSMLSPLICTTPYPHHFATLIVVLSQSNGTAATNVAPSLEPGLTLAANEGQALDTAADGDDAFAGVAYSSGFTQVSQVQVATAGFTCYLFVYALWTITAIMSLATTYVAYICCISIFGSLVPHMFDSSQRWERGWLSMFLLLWWTALLVTLAVGSFFAAFIIALPLLLLSQAVG